MIFSGSSSLRSAAIKPIRPKRVILVLSAMFLSLGAARGGELPDQLVGSWAFTSESGIPITGIGITRNSYHEPGYNCSINRVRDSTDSADYSARVSIVTLSCRSDGLD